MVHPSFQVLRNTFSREHLIDHCKNNGVKWAESNHEGVNWMRLNRSLKNHLDADGEFHTDNLDDNTATSMYHQYHQMRELHKKTMIPHLKATMAKLSQDEGGGKHPSEYLHSAFKHLEANGGHIWRSKLHHIIHLNNKINELGKRIKHIT